MQPAGFYTLRVSLAEIADQWIIAFVIPINAIIIAGLEAFFALQACIFIMLYVAKFFVDRKCTDRARFDAGSFSTLNALVDFNFKSFLVHFDTNPAFVAIEIIEMLDRASQNAA
jgi:hypothetical protein